MTANLHDARFKLEEAAFHIELLYLIQKSGASITHIGNLEKEASYLFSAILNAFYSVTEICGSKTSMQVRNFKNLYPLIYSRSEKGGLRNTSVHVRHIQVENNIYAKPAKGTVVLRFGVSPKLSMPDFTHGVVKLRFEKVFHIEIDNELLAIAEFCNEHLKQLTDFVDSVCRNDATGI
ncbi:hypothetical protein [Rheinheimera aquimaris]|jgi:hypothetical protein|uniref:hypothetical protein n=1 Tax=Rheinheimera aquimaris TaxID=412437 RepID=UPI0010651732|nr:hypothetical protein [Rheinheimera aquimaris]